MIRAFKDQIAMARLVDGAPTKFIFRKSNAVRGWIWIIEVIWIRIVNDVKIDARGGGV